MEFIQVSCSATRIDLSKTFCGVPLFLKLNCNSIPHSPLMTIISTSPYISQHKFSNKQTKEENAGRPDTAVHFYAPLPNVVIWFLRLQLCTQILNHFCTTYETALIFKDGAVQEEVYFYSDKSVLQSLSSSGIHKCILT